jgi:hypothetical protein
MRHALSIRSVFGPRSLAPSVLRLPVLLTLLAVSGLSCRAGAPRSTAQPVWNRVVVVGASASAGFTEAAPLGSGSLEIHRYLDAALVAPHEPMTNLANVTFFMQPNALGEAQITQALQAKPTMVVGLDFLFWYCYGEGESAEGARLRHFEQGLKLLESVPCRLLLGDIPDASDASKDMLSPDMIPSHQEIAAANSRLKEWAAAHKNVVIVPLNQLMKAAATDQALTVHGRVLPAGQTRAMLQPDGLHPSSYGCAVLAVATMDALVSSQSSLPAKQVRWDPAEVQRLAHAAVEGRR